MPWIRAVLAYVERDELAAAVDLGPHRRRAVVHFDQPRGAQTAAGEKAGQERQDVRAPLDRPQRGPDLAASVVPDHHVLAQQVGQGGQIAVLHRIEEAPQQLTVRLRVGVEPFAAGGEVTGRAAVQLTAVRRHADDRGDLVVGQFERLPQHEHRPLRRGQTLHQMNGRVGERVPQLGGLRRPERFGGDRFGQPRPGVRLARHARRPQLIQCQARDDGDEEGAWDADRGAVRRGPAQIRLLHHVLGVPHAAQKPVSEAQEQRPVLLEDGVGGFWCRRWRAGHRWTLRRSSVQRMPRRIMPPRRRRSGPRARRRTGDAS